MSSEQTISLLVAMLDLGWGSIGKLRLILDQLPGARVALHGDDRIITLAKELLGAHCDMQDLAQRPDVALVVNDPKDARDLIGHRIPVIYVDSVPYMRRTEAELPPLEKLACYCAQKYPTELMPLPSRLQRWHDIKWIDPIVPPLRARRGGRGIVVSVGGLTNPTAGVSADAYVKLVLIPLVEFLRASGRTVLAICGSLSNDVCRQLRTILPECNTIGPQVPRAFEHTLTEADLLFAAPGSTTILQAAALSLPTILLPPQNRTQIFNVRLFAKPDADVMQWPTRLLDPAKLEQLLPQGRDLGRRYVYDAIMTAAASQKIADEIATAIRKAVDTSPAEGVLRSDLSTFGFAGARQVAELVSKTVSGRMAVPLESGT
jgi:hydroxymethylcytosylglucuronate/cytosylglucuronate synthase